MAGSAEHPGRGLVAAIDYLDLSEVIASYSLGGSDALSPRMMLRMIVIEMWEGRGTHPSQWFKDAATSDVLESGRFRSPPLAIIVVQLPRPCRAVPARLVRPDLKAATRCGMTNATWGSNRFSSPRTHRAVAYSTRNGLNNTSWNWKRRWWQIRRAQTTAFDHAGWQAPQKHGSSSVKSMFRLAAAPAGLSRDQSSPAGQATTS